MLQKTKSMLLKVLICLCLVCCLVAALVTAAACNKSDPTVVGGEIDSRGHLILTMSDGSTKDVGLVTGSNGSDGSDGTNGKNGVGIESIDFDPATGKLVIKLTDGSEVKLTIPEYPETCPVSEDGKHAWTDVHQVCPANCQSPETWFQVCVNDGCDAKRLNYVGEKDLTNHLEMFWEDNSVKATCTMDGLNDVVCSACDEVVKHELVPALGHKAPEFDTKGELARNEDGSIKIGQAKWYEVVDEGKNICEDGGQRLLMCPQCLEMVYYAEEIAPAKHKVTKDWIVTKEPTLTETGLLTGPCGREGCGKADATYELPKLNKSDYEYTEVRKASCSETIAGQTGLETYKITIDGVEFTFEVESSRLHRFVFVGTGSEEAPEFTANYSGAIDDPDVEYEDNKYLGHFDNSTATCQEHGYAEFDCKDCGGHIIIKIHGAHDITGQKPNGKKQAPTCTQDGWTGYDCKYCGTNVPKVEDGDKATGHTWVVTVDEKDPVGPDGIKATVSRDCSVCGAHEGPFNCTTWEEDPAQSKETGCEEVGYKTYKYAYTDASGKQQTGTWKINNTDKAGHRIKYTDSEMKEQWFVFDKGVGKDAVYDLDELPKEVVELLGNFDNEKKNCKDPYLVSFDCQGTCESNVPGKEHGHYVIQVKAHDWKLEETLHKDPTCTTPGYDVYKCTVCGETKDVKDEDEPALGHDLEASLTADKKKVTLTCQREDCDYSTTVELDKTKPNTNGTGIEHKDATCLEKGYDYYWYLDNGVSKKVEVEIPVATTHTLGTIKDIDLKADPKVQYDAETLLAAGKGNATSKGFDNSDPTCKESGFIEFDCDVCHKHFVIEVLGQHHYVAKSQAATCTEDGATWEECSECGTEKPNSRTTLKALGHNWIDPQLTAPTMEESGSFKSKCSRCEEEKDITFPALSDTSAYTKTTVTAAKCNAEGLDRYTYNADKSFTFDVVTPKIPHGAEGDKVTWVSEDGTTYYEGHICGVCEQIVVDRSAKVSDCTYETLAEPKEGEYFLSLYQGKKEQRLFVNGKMNGFYLDTTANAGVASRVTLHKSGKGWAIRIDGKYLEILYVKGSDGAMHVNIVLSETQTEGAIWKWNEEAKVFTMTANNKEYYIGTYTSTNNPEGFTTMSASEITRITGDNAKNVGVSQFPAYLGNFVIPEAE